MKPLDDLFHVIMPLIARVRAHLTHLPRTIDSIVICLHIITRTLASKFFNVYGSLLVKKLNFMPNFTELCSVLCSLNGTIKENLLSGHLK